MKKIQILILCFIAGNVSLNAQSKKKQDASAIKEMCGCYEVTFNFAE
ncbi:MAG: DUF6607 family protein, partial [Bacteroidota bacterium]